MEKYGFLSRLGGMVNTKKIPLVEVAGCERVLIENYTGVMSYSPEEIVIRVNYGCLQIIGERMILAEMRREQLVITGKIYSVHLHRR